MNSKLPSYQGLALEARTYLRRLLAPGSEPVGKFVIFGRGRSGSTMLADLLARHSQICCEDEILHHRVLFPTHFVQSRSRLFGAPVYGFKLLLYELFNVQRVGDPEGYLHYLHDSNFKIIHLERRNVLRHALSNLYARYRGVFHWANEDGERRPALMQVDLDELSRWIQGSERFAAKERDVLSALAYLPVMYEDDLSEPAVRQRTLERIWEYLGVGSETVRSSWTKVTPTRLREFVTNHEEVGGFALENGLGWCLDDYKDG